jgi:hypothetical protein
MAPMGPPLAPLAIGYTNGAIDGIAIGAIEPPMAPFVGAFFGNFWLKVPKIRYVFHYFIICNSAIYRFCVRLSF